MPLTAIANGQATDATQLNQLINLLTGVMADQPVTLKADNTRAGAQLILDTVNAAQQAATVYRDGGTIKWQLGKNTDNSFFLYDYVRAANVLTFAQNGALTITPATTITGLLTATLATAAQPNITSLGTLTGLTINGLLNFSGVGGYQIGSGVASGLYFDTQNIALRWLTGGAVYFQGPSGSPSIGTIGPSGLGFSGQPATFGATTLASLIVTGATDLRGNVNANGSYVTFNAGLYASAGTSYFQTLTNFRGGIQNDQGDLQLGQGTSSAKSFTKYRAKAHNNASTSIGTSWTQIALQAVDYDPNSNFASNAYTVPVAGYYLVHAKMTTYSINSGLWFESSLRKNGTEFDRDSQSSGSITSDNANITGIYLFAANDVITLWGAISSGSAATWSPDGTSFSSLTVHFLSSP